LTLRGAEDYSRAEFFMAKRELDWTWIIVSQDDEGNCWVEETSDGAHRGKTLLGILAPEQVRHITGALEKYRVHGFRREQFESAFHVWKMESQLSDGRWRLVPADVSIYDGIGELFALPDVPLDLAEELEATGGYPDFLEQLEHLRIRHLNRTRQFLHDVDELDMEDDLRLLDTDRYFCGEPVHCFEQICEILEWSPDGEPEDHQG
jgi:hypothetical protein